MHSQMLGHAAHSWMCCTFPRWPWALDSAAITASDRKAPSHAKFIANHCSKCALRCVDACTSLDGAAEHRPRSQQIYREAMQHTQTLMLGCAAHPSAATGRHGCLRHGSDRLRSQWIHRQALHQIRIQLRGCAAHLSDGAAVSAMVSIAPGHNRSCRLLQHDA